MPQSGLQLIIISGGASFNRRGCKEMLRKKFSFDMRILETLRATGTVSEQHGAIARQCASQTLSSAISCGDLLGDGRLFGLPASAAGGADVIKGDRPAIEAHQSERERRQGQRKFVSVVARQSVVEVHLGDSDAHINA